MNGTVSADARMKKIVLVACAGLKQKQPSPAKELYTSPLLREARRYAEREGDAWYILSAKHGLVRPDDVLDPYDATLARMKAQEREVWALRVFRQLAHEGVTKDDQVVFLAGHFYRAYLEKLLHAAGNFIAVPMTGLGIGKQIVWLRQRNKERTA